MCKSVPVVDEARKPARKGRARRPLTFRQVCAATLQAWLDDPLNQLSIEEGASGDVDSFADLLEAALSKSGAGLPESTRPSCDE
jgi:hypothetical protein